MHHIMGIYYKVLICIYRSGLIFYFALSMGCLGGHSSDHQNENKKTPH